MSRGIIKDNPTSTSGKVIVVVDTENTYPLERYATLTFAPNAELPLVKGDAVELTIDSTTTCKVTKKLAAPQGTVTIASFDARGGEIELTIAEPNDFQKRIGDKVRFNFIDLEGDERVDPDATIQVVIESDTHSKFVKIL